MPNEMDWFGLMRGITELHVKSIASPALASEDALAGTESGGEHPINSSPLHKFDAPSSQERSGGDRGSQCGMDTLEILSHDLRLPETGDSPLGQGQPRGASIHSGDTITRLMDAVAVCEERSRR